MLHYFRKSPIRTIIVFIPSITNSFENVWLIFNSYKIIKMNIVHFWTTQFNILFKKNFELNEDNSGIVFRRLVIFTSSTFYSLSTSCSDMSCHSKSLLNSWHELPFQEFIKLLNWLKDISFMKWSGSSLQVFEA